MTQDLIAMTSTRGYYSIVQYCPDPSRLEAVNIGVVLFCPEWGYLRARFARRKTPISQLFGHQDWEFVELQQSAIAARLSRDLDSFKTIEDLQTYISRRANALTMTPPRPVKVVNPDWELNSLRKRLVGTHREAVNRAGAVSKELAVCFRTGGVESKLSRDVSVHPPMLPRPFKAPFAYQNGRLNLIEPVQFEGHTLASVFNRASARAVEGQFLADYIDPQFGKLGLVVVAKFAPEQVQERKTAETVFRTHNVPMYTFAGIESLLEDIRQQAH